MKKWLLFGLLALSIPAFGQDCSGKIKAALASKEAGNYRLALAQLSAAAGSCGEGRRAEIEKEILDIYDRIERLKDDALMARELAEMVKKMPKLDWTQRESVRATLRRNVRRMLAKYGYPPDLAEGATQLILRQAELSTENGA